MIYLVINKLIYLFSTTINKKIIANEREPKAKPV